MFIVQFDRRGRCTGEQLLLLVTDNPSQCSVSVCVAENMVSVQCPQVYSQCAVLCTLCSVLVNAGPPYLLPLTGQASELSLSLPLLVSLGCNWPNNLHL